MFQLAETSIGPILSAARRQTEDDIKSLLAFEGIHRSLALSEYVQTEAVRAWERSKKPKSKRSASKEKSPAKGAGAGRETDKVSTATEDRDGDRGYLELALKADENMRKLLGIDAPTVQRYVMTTDAKLEEGADALETARGIGAGELARIYRETISASA